MDKSEIKEVCDNGFEEFWVRFSRDFPYLIIHKTSFIIAYQAGFLKSSDFLIGEFLKKVSPSILADQIVKDITGKK